ncbi:hypothetical protein [Streptococcus thoraltensis]|uniref:hypothetical protein n=1 Tax=Streptococcus thoraltensis TaxID=55085 RepID=UPI00036789FC|nr:hypothetical protein [Streptococcus thoraltensis]MDY4762378.1 hypothetical protein [Streptococcus thoraltensis]
MIDYKEWWEQTRESSELNFLHSQFRKNFLEELTILEYRPLFYKFFQNKQLKHWNREGFKFLNSKIRQLESQLGKEKFINVFLSNFELWISMYEQLLDIEERINLMELFNGSEELRAKIFAVSIYNDLLNSAYSNGLKLIIKFHGEILSKNQDQKTLTPQIEYLRKRDYNLITDISDSDVRNAISHGGIRYNYNTLSFHFTQGSISGQKEISTFQFITDIKEIFDITSSMCLSWLYYWCQNISLDKLRSFNNLSKTSIKFIDKLFLSTLLFECKQIDSLIPVYAKGGTQYNLEFQHDNLDVNSRYCLGVYSAQKFLKMKNIESGNYIHLSFQSSKSMSSFFNISTEQLIDFSNGKIEFKDIISSIIPNSMMWEINDEERNEIEDNFRFYPDINNEAYVISEITDISLENTKRFSAVFVLIKEVTKFQIKKLIKEAIEQISSIENYGFASNKVKYGKMSADIVYLTVYRNQLRRNKKRELFPENDNFICYVQYDRSKKFPIHNTIVDPYLKKNREGYLEFNWNPNYEGVKQ